MTYRPLIIVPFYNHLHCFQKIAEHYADTKHPVLVINDGSSESETEGVKKLANKYHFNYLELPQNSGKGAAVITALKWAFSNGYTHAVQIDADGQHNYKDIPDFIRLSQKHPKCIINGTPIYDESVPKSRLYGRKVTNFWVWIETGGANIQDAMCGFKVFPLTQMEPILPLIYFKRMGFDIEILVKSYLNGIDIVPYPTKIIYPKDGLSHFKGFADNMQIALTHTMLCCYALYKRLFSWRKHV